MPPKIRKGTVYLQVSPKGNWTELRLERAGSNKPRVQIGGTLLIKLNLEIPQKAFEPLEPTATVIVDDSFVVASPISIEQVDAEELPPSMSVGDTDGD